MKMTKAFTMIELIFVIVILGILSAVALPKFTGIKNQADIVTGKAQIATIRTAIANDRQSGLILGNSAYITIANLSTSSTSLFGGVLTSAITGSNTLGTAGEWHTDDALRAAGTYYYGATRFDYNNTSGIFDCTPYLNDCNSLTNR